MEKITLQAFIVQEWRDIAIIHFPKHDHALYASKYDITYPITELEYETNYSVDYLYRDDNYAVSINHPVALYFDDNGSPGWLKFLDDIVPSGASRRYWIQYLDIANLTVEQQNYELLYHGTISPIGNLRVKESLPTPSSLNKALVFTIDDVKNRASDFLDYAQRKGAAAGGATGAGGEAPKLLLRCSKNEEVWIDTYQDDASNLDKYYLVKFPRGNRSSIDCDILRAEYHFYHELTAMGFNTISIEGMRLEEGNNYPSLWLPRFDIKIENNEVIRLAMESVYSMLNKAPGTTLYHETAIRELIDKINQSNMVTQFGFQFDTSDFIIEWVRRDLLNIIFGNSDNHGRNTSFIRYNNAIYLAPIYDFAPMKADPEGIARTTKWNSQNEMGGEYSFINIANSLSDLIPQEQLLNALKETALQLITLKERLEIRGVPTQILTMPSFGFDFIPNKLERWGLLS
ncbi:HipA domain-containing protein [Proteus vulgaris]|uniref:Type II toxin-antitoxin system HipA family toxin n=2 Tax=Proteus vulgaris TaxID=585 RepID=A0A6G6SN80_PROVU|nr:HipA domain-containing protein [Proteus vulgaris]QIF96194.1 type II toxin-antitoxin system HipA family toxin [Proteus vulgaris]WIF71830.1 HipA domain-containing protein [Proteus vulgaris]CRL61609.1 putative DNA-binding transcriptional regulator [Proteus vulgaris]